MSAEEKNNTALNEFDQPVKGVSLWNDAWKRLKKNRMAMFGMYVVIFYMFISIFAPVLPIYSFKHQIIDHQYLPPSLTKTAGQLYYERSERLMNALADKQNRELNQEELAELEAIKHQIATETAVIDGKEVRIHERRYIFGTDYLGRDMLARVVYGGQISIAIGFIGTITSVFYRYSSGSNCRICRR